LDRSLLELYRIFKVLQAVYLISKK